MTLEEIGNRNEEDDVHRRKRVSTPPLVKMRGTRRVLRDPFVGHTCSFDGKPEVRAFLSMSSSLPTFQSETATSSVRSTTRPGMVHSWHEEKLHSHEHYVPRFLRTEKLYVDWQYVPNRHRANLDEVRRTSGNDAPLAQKQSRPVLLVHTDHDENLPAGLPTKKGTQVEWMELSLSYPSSCAQKPLGTYSCRLTTRHSAYNFLLMRATHFIVLWKGVSRILLAENLAGTTLPRKGSICSQQY